MNESVSCLCKAISIAILWSLPNSRMACLISLGISIAYFSIFFTHFSHLVVLYAPIVEIYRYDQHVNKTNFFRWFMNSF